MCDGCWGEYVWIVAMGGILAFFTAYGIGANDVANAFASSVGAKAITIKQAIMIAAVFEFAGAVLLGANVTKTVRKGIADGGMFKEDPELLMYGMMTVIFCTGVWLVLASYLELPVSTTHSTVGGVIGMALTAKGSKAVVWAKESDEFPYVKGVAAIVLSWVFSPVLSGVFAVFLFATTRFFVLRSPASFERCWFAFPLLVAGTIAVNVYFIIYKGIKVKVNGKKASDTPIWFATTLAFGIGAASGLIMYFVGQYYLRPLVVKTMERREQEAAEGITGKADESQEPAEGEKGGFMSSMSSRMTAGLNKDVHQVIQENDNVHNVHDTAEQFDPQTEEAFKYLQVFTAICDSFAHGANDVANSIGPFAATYSIYRERKYNKSSDVPKWILVLGGVGIVVGLSTYGYNIMRAIGVKLTKITPSRGFAIELGAAIVVVIGSRYGIPLSTTHCQVGATTGVGMLEGKGGVNWMLLAKVVGGWIITLVVVGFSVAAVFAQAAFAPSVNNLKDIARYETMIEEHALDFATFVNDTEYAKTSTWTEFMTDATRIANKVEDLEGTQTIEPHQELEVLTETLALAKAYAESLAA